MTCKHCRTTASFQSSITRKTYSILNTISCGSTKIIYLITCSLCKKQYVGQTEQTLPQRMNAHRHSIIHNTHTAVAKHFNLPDHDITNLQIIGIDSLPTADTYARMNKETYWIHTLRTLTPDGINVKEQLVFPITYRLSQGNSCL